MADDKKPIPVQVGESGRRIPMPAGSLASLIGSVAVEKGPESLNQVIRASGHVDRSFIPPAVGSKTQQQQQTPVRHVQGTPKVIFAQGQSFYDKNKECKVVIVQANAGITKTSKTPCHKVANKKGKTWLAKQTDLVKLP